MHEQYLITVWLMQVEPRTNDNGGDDEVHSNYGAKYGEAEKRLLEAENALLGAALASQRHEKRFLSSRPPALPIVPCVRSCLWRNQPGKSWA